EVDFVADLAPTLGARAAAYGVECQLDGTPELARRGIEAGDITTELDPHAVIASHQVPSSSSQRSTMPSVSMKSCSLKRPSASSSTPPRLPRTWWVRSEATIFT